ncbi:MAG: transcriptional repressor [Desulfobacterales bacterium]
MKQIHIREKEQFKKLFRQEQIDNFEDRFKVLEVFLQTESHVTIAELVELLDQNGWSIDAEFVRETMKLMCRFGFAHQSDFNNGAIRYEHRHLGQHHDHMICTKCRKIIEFKENRLEELQIQIAATHGFHMLQHKMERMRLLSMGLRLGDEIEVITNSNQGQMAIAADFKRFVLGRGLAQKILVEPINLEKTRQQNGKI